MKILSRVSLAALVALSATALSTSVLGAQGNKPPVAKLQIDKGPITAGGKFKATLTVTFPEGLHAYQNPASDETLIPIEVKAGDKVFSVVAVAYPKGTPTTLPGESKPINIYTGTIKIPVTLKAPAKAGKTPLKLTFNYQECNDQSCFPPGTLTLDASVVVKEAPADPKVGS